MLIAASALVAACALLVFVNVRRATARRLDEDYQRFAAQRDERMAAANGRPRGQVIAIAPADRPDPKGDL